MAAAEGEQKTIKSCFQEAEIQRKKLESSAFTSSSSNSYQELLNLSILSYNECVNIADRVSLFSPNESLEDISSGDLQYLLIHFYLAELISRLSSSDRKTTILRSRTEYEAFLQILDSYDILSATDAKTYAQFLEARATFSVASTTDAAARRATKISRFKEEKALKTKLEYLSSNPAATSVSADDAAVRELHLTHISLRVHQTFAALEGIAQELSMLGLAPPLATSPSATNDTQSAASDTRSRARNDDSYSERLDSPSQFRVNGATGPILSSTGQPLRPFTLLDTRARLRDGVFRPDHNLPTMTIDEYLEEERRRGGIIEKGQGGEASGIIPDFDEDDMAAVDKRTHEQRRWDVFKEDNPRGAGNTMNMG